MLASKYGKCQAGSISTTPSSAMNSEETIVAMTASTVVGSGEGGDGLQRCGETGVGDVLVEHGAGEIGLVRRQVQVTVSAERGEDDLLLTRLLARQGFPDAGGERVGRLWRRQDALGPGELDTCREALRLRDGDGLHETRLVDVADERRHPVVAKPARVDRVRDEVVAEGVHLQQRRHPGGVAEVVGVHTSGQ